LTARISSCEPRLAVAPINISPVIMELFLVG